MAFWIFVIGGLALRYRARRPRIGAAVLMLAPLTDLVLLVLAVLALHDGAVVDWSYGLAAVYLGVSVVFGRDLIAGADRRFRLGSSPAARRMNARDAWALWRRAVTAGAISAALLVGCALLIRGASQTGPLLAWLPNIGLVLAVWLAHPLWRSVASQRLHRSDPCS